MYAAQSVDGSVQNAAEMRWYPSAMVTGTPCFSLPLSR